MVIGIDGSRAFISHRTGIEEYSYQVIKNLRDKLDGHEVVLYVRKTQEMSFPPPLNEDKLRRESSKTNLDCGLDSRLRGNDKEGEAFALPKNWKIKVIWWPFFWTQIGLSLEILFHPVDALFVPAHTVPWIHPKKTIVTIHGLEYEMTPQAYSFLERLYMRLSIKFSCHWAEKIISVSKNTRKDLIELYDVPEDKIEVIYEGRPEAQSEKLKVQSRSLKLKIEKPFLFFVGRLERRKNVEGIIEAYRILKEKYEISHKLVLAGKAGFGYESIKYKVESSKYKAEIVETGFVNDETKLELLKNADVFLFPSFYEGFGLPVLEAQEAGVPVVASNVSSLPEVAGKGAFYCDPIEPESIAQSIWKAIGDQTARDDIIKKGKENAKRFSWEKCAREIVKLIDD